MEEQEAMGRNWSTGHCLRIKGKKTNNQTQTKKPDSDLLYWEGDQILEEAAQTGSHRKCFPNWTWLIILLEFYTLEQQPHLFWKNIVYCPQNYNHNQLLWLNPHKNKSADQLSKVHSEILIIEVTGRSATNY